LSDPVRLHPDGATLAVRAVPGASAAKIVGLHGDELRVRVCSPPVDGRANDEILKVVAAAVGVRAREVVLSSGHTSRSKQLVVHLAPEVLRARLARWIGPEQAPDR
jgi:uncharacterized protein